MELVIVGPEAPLAAGSSTSLRAAGIVRVLGPTREAAQLESRSSGPRVHAAVTASRPRRAGLRAGRRPRANVDQLQGSWC